MRPTRLSPDDVYKLGRKYIFNTTIDSDFIPLRGAGSYICGVLAKTGKAVKLLDLTSGIGINPFGHRKKKRPFLPGNEWYNPKEVELAMVLCEEVAPKGPEWMVFYCNSGAESVEAALKMCDSFRYHSYCRKYGNQADGKLHFKRVVCAFGGAFHGRTRGALALNCSKKKHTEAFCADRGDLSVGVKVKDERAVPVRHLPFPEKDDAASIAAFKQILDEDPFVDAHAMVLELVQGEGGIRPIDPECLRLLVDDCRKNDVYIIADEVQTGMMRTGKMLACEHYGLVPDIICLSKALSGGEVPIGATIARAEFNFPRPGEHSNTFGGNPPAVAAALRTIRRLQRLSAKKMERRSALLAELAPKGIGLMRRLDFATPELRDAFTERARELGALMISAGEKSARIMPPLNISIKNLKKAGAIIKQALAEVGA